MELAEKWKALVAEQERLIYAAADHIWANPETGYREWKTSAYMAEQFETLGYTLVKAGDIPGFYADLDTGRPGPRLAILGELDSLIVGNHPDADPETAAVHACGHHAQCAVLLGVAAALNQPGALEGLSGSIRFMAVPAEELIELEFREELRQKGIIKYFGGKVEFLYRGYFDGVDLAMMIHSGSLPEGKALELARGCNGCITKNIMFKGVSAHAGGAPELGKNALYAANCAINAVNCLRETFVDDEHIRFHPIITEGGMAVNAIPERVKLESYVRGAEFESIVAYNQRINQALAASAAALGCRVELDDHPGYFPLNNDENLMTLMAEAMELVAGPGSVCEGRWSTGCTDMGDISAVMPAAHPHCGGSVGTAHGKDYYVADKKRGCLYPAQCLAVTAAMLLEKDGERARKVIAESTPYFRSKEEYLTAMDRLTVKKEAVVYHDDGIITLDVTNKHDTRRY